MRHFSVRFCLRNKPSGNINQSFNIFATFVHLPTNRGNGNIAHKHSNRVILSINIGKCTFALTTRGFSVYLVFTLFRSLYCFLLTPAPFSFNSMRFNLFYSLEEKRRNRKPRKRRVCMHQNN